MKTIQAMGKINFNKMNLFEEKNILKATILILNLKLNL